MAAARAEGEAAGRRAEQEKAKLSAEDAARDAIAAVQSEGRDMLDAALRQHASSKAEAVSAALKHGERRSRESCVDSLGPHAIP